MNNPRKIFLAFAAAVVAPSFLVVNVVDAATMMSVGVECLPEEPDVCIGELYGSSPSPVTMGGVTMYLGGHSWTYDFVSGLEEGTNDFKAIEAAKTGLSITISINDDGICHVLVGDVTCSSCSTEGCNSYVTGSIKYDCTNLDNGGNTLDDDECVSMEPFIYPFGTEAEALTMMSFAPEETDFPMTEEPEELIAELLPAPTITTILPGPGSGSGDPHFKTWTGDKYDYHGECDLVLVDHPSFSNGLGLKVHIRTTRVKYFSYISNIAVQIGDDVLEFDNDVTNFLINGETAPPKRKYVRTLLGGFHVRRDPKAISIRFDDNVKARIDLIQRTNGWPAVVVDGATTEVFKDSLGLLGDWETGKRLARDGKTLMDDPDATAFALEWQVRDTEPMLFKEARFPQYPRTCTPPAQNLSKRLGVSNFEKEAEKACAHWKEDIEDCVFDVIATRDVMVAAEGHIGAIA